jgi:hypothetical protein
MTMDGMVHGVDYAGGNGQRHSKRGVLGENDRILSIPRTTALFDCATRQTAT